MLGKNGQVGWELQRALAPLGELIALDRQGDVIHGYAGDIGNLTEISLTIWTLKPDVVVNATAYTAVDRAETEQDAAWQINAEAVANLAAVCKEVNALFVHYSTDYVFDGTGTTPHLEWDKTNPVNYYGLSKLAGETHIAAAQGSHFIFRTSWVYAAKGNNFIKTILKLARTRDELKIIDDQVGAPTGAALIADVTAHAIRYYFQHATPSLLHGIYHLSASGETSWFNYAQYFIEQAKLRGETFQVQQILPIPSSQFPTPSQRPLNSRLNNQKLQSVFNLTLPHWQQGVNHVLSEILGS